MIVTSYAQFRDIFSASTSYDADGYKHFDVNAVSTIIPDANLPSIPLVLPTEVTWHPTGSEDSKYDGSYGVDDYNWYLSACTTENPLIEIRQHTEADENPGSTSRRSYSGTVHLQLTSTGESLVEFPLSENEIHQLFTNAYLICHRVSDNKVHVIDLLKAALAE